MFCPSCRSEFRPGFDACQSCGGIALVDVLPALESLHPHEIEDTAPVGWVSSPDLKRLVDLQGRQYDLMRLFSLKQAQELSQVVIASGVPALVVPTEAQMGDGVARFEVRVRKTRQEEVEAMLRRDWARALDDVEAEGSEVPVDECPACGASVGLDQEECPDCGLFVGALDDEDEALN